jgi:hypothetical protein
MKTKVILYFSATLKHNHQIYCGLEILKQKGVIDLQYVYDFKKRPINLTLVEVDGIRLLLDTNDNHGFDINHYNNCDFFVKRMLHQEDQDRYPKMIPFGLNYSVFAPNSYLQTLFLKDRKHLPFSVRYNWLVSSLCNINESIYTSGYRSFGNAKNDNGKIIFSTRLWNPENGNEDWKKEERQFINNERIELIRQLSAKYDDRFMGGIQDEALARELCPDIILANKTTNKKRYLGMIKNFSIGVCNKGLEDSIGWKFAEYIADSLAVVSNPISHYVHHGNLSKELHFLEYESVEQCMTQIERLSEDVALRKQISANNKKYYEEYLHPEAKFREIFRLAGIPL